MFNLCSAWEYRNIYEMLSVEDGATHTPLHWESTLWAEKDSDEVEKGNEVQPRCRRSPAVVSMIMARRGVAKTSTTTDREESQVRQKKSERGRKKTGEGKRQKKEACTGLGRISIYEDPQKTVYSQNSGSVNAVYDFTRCWQDFLCLPWMDRAGGQSHIVQVLCAPAQPVWIPLSLPGKWWNLEWNKLLIRDQLNNTHVI